MLHRYSQFVVCFTVLLIIAGGLVTSTGSGLAVPDWPLSYGQWMPPMVGGIRYEHSHRMIAASVGLLTLILTIWMLAVEKKKWLRQLSIIAFFAVVLQGILGGLTVKYLLPPPISIFHACLAQTFFALLVSIAYATSREWSEPMKYSADLSRLRRLLFITAAFIYTQLILGAAIRHTGIVSIVIPHIFLAFLVLLHAALVLVHVFRFHSGIKKLTVPAFSLGILALIQISLGMGAFMYRFMLGSSSTPSAGEVFFRTAHQTTGALLLSAAVFFILRVCRTAHVNKGAS